MNTNCPSIFNDVIGPIMRGPSSSHCAASVRIGRLARDLMDEKLDEIIIQFDPKGSLATTHESQGSDMGLFAGFLGWDISDERLVNSANAIHENGIKIQIAIVDYGAQHPNTYKFILKNAQETHEMIAISTGGGMVEIIEIDRVPVSMAGDFVETLVYISSNEEEILKYFREKITADDIILCQGNDTTFIEIKGQDFLPEELCRELHGKDEVLRIKELSPVVPVLSRKGMEVPFITCDEMLTYNADKDRELWELALDYESARGDISRGDVFEKMKNIVGIMERSIKQGIAGTEYKDRILDYQSGAFKTQMEGHYLLDVGLLNHMILYVTAMMEIKSSMGVIVAAPTAGACAGLPGACLGAARALGLSDEKKTKGMLAAGMIGIFIAAHATFAAEVGGCQAECGAGSGMAASALVTLAKGTTQQAINASSMALQNILGMICDPVANRVEVPCLGRNVLAASNAVASANMALANFDPVIPLDEVIETMEQVGKSLPYELRCTALGGLSVTKTSKKISEKLST